jgi:hypothetical protein
VLGLSGLSRRDILLGIENVDYLYINSILLITKYYKDLGEEGKVKNDAVFHEYKLKKQKEFLSEFRALASTDVMSMFYSSAFLMTKSFIS